MLLAHAPNLRIYAVTARDRLMHAKRAVFDEDVVFARERRSETLSINVRGLFEYASAHLDAPVEPAELVNRIFTRVFDSRLAPVLSSPGAYALAPPSECLKNGFAR